MVDQPMEGVELSDEDLDEAVQAALAEDDASTGALPDTTAEPVEQETADDNSDPASADNAPAGDAPPEPVVAAQPVQGSALETASAPAAPVVGKPFQFKASGRDHSLPWASELPDGSVVIPKDKRDEFQRELASAREFPRARREFDRQLADARTQRTQKDADADASIALMAELVQLTPEAQWQYLQELQGNLPRLQIDLERRKLQEQQKLFEQQQKGPQLSVEEQQEQFTEQVRGELDATFAHIENTPEFKSLTAEDKQMLRDRWQGRPELLVRRATEDMPQHGIAKGDLLFDPKGLLEDAKFLAANRKPAAPPAPSTKAVARNAALNADRQTPVNPIPPSVRSQTPTGQPRAKNGQYRAAANNRQFREDFMKNDEDDE